jgi:hypothetical protein
MLFHNHHRDDKWLFIEETDWYPRCIEFTEIAHILRFPWVTIEKYFHLKKYNNSELHKYSSAYFRWKWWIEREDRRHYLEWPHSIVLFFDAYPICNVAYSFSKDGIVIHQMQWVRYWDQKRLKVHNYYLDTFDWKKVLVEIVWKIAILSGKEEVYIQAAFSNVARWAWSDEWERVYDKTAMELQSWEPIVVSANLPKLINLDNWNIWRRIVMQRTRVYPIRVSTLLSSKNTD